ncbi:MAG: DUF1501 domain-containing protein [Planctomycetota bacterium]|nr:DUF1501 domain-containing protein [Planctomycetota bacterium]
MSLLKSMSSPNLSPLSRRDWLGTVGGGFATLGLAGALHAAETAQPRPLTVPKVKRVIQLFMNGGPFQGDLFDPKPRINEFAGQRPQEVQLRTENATGGLMAVPYKFDRHGTSGLEISDLLPRLSAHADDLCVLRSMHTDNPNHGPALFMMNNGTITPLRPSMGSWMLYGLGSENENLPGYVVLCPGRPVRFSEMWTNSFLPAQHQGTYINHSDLAPDKMVPFLKNPVLDVDSQRKQLAFLRELNTEHLATRDADPALEGRIRAMETAFRMQFAASDAFDLAREPAALREEYGSSHFSNGCLLARRLVERGVRLVQVYYGDGQPWDTHRTHDELTRKLCADIDLPIAALLADLKRTGLLDDTLVVWGGEFGRTPTSESGNGRDHNHWGFTMWLAGAGVRGGMAYGATDDFGFRAVQDKVHVHDLHATILHLMGLDHERLTYRHAGRDYRLTDLYGRVVHEILA